MHPRSPNRTRLAGALIILVAATGATGLRPASDAWREREEAGERYATRRGDGLPPKSPNPWFFNERAYPFGRIPMDEWHAARVQAAALRRQTPLTASTWTPRGPTNIGGRITDIAVHPTDGNVVYAGAAEGGVLRTDDGGQSWTPLFDDQPAISIGALAIDPANPDVVYAGTGEVNPGGGGVAYGGVGLFRSVNGGATWESLGLEESAAIGRIRVDPTDSDRIFVAVMGRLWEESPERGVYRTTDGGATWDRVLHTSDRTGCVDLVMRPDDPDVLYAAMWERLRQPESYDYGGPGCAVYRTLDGGGTWTLVAGGLPAPDGGGGRIGLSLCASDPDVMHAVYADRIGYFDGLYRSTDGGFTWSRTNDGSLSDVFASYGWWFGNVRTHPTDPNRIFVLGLPFYRSTNGGGSYGNASDSMHVDHHALAFGPGANPVMYAGNDGGVYRSTNGGSAWTKLPDLPVTQAYRIALDANNPNACYIGAQDNGTLRTLTGQADDWDHIYGGDGFQPLVHPESSNRVWAEYQYGNLAYSSNQGGSWTGATGGVSGADRFNWNTLHVQDPTDADRRYFGTNRLYRSTGNTSWTAISPDLTGGPGQQGGQVNGTLTTASVSAPDPDVIWTGSDDGLVHVTTNGGGSWTEVSQDLPVRWITSVRADPFVRETAYVTISGFRWSESIAHVYRTDNLGAVWFAIDGNLPDAPANEILPDPGQPDRFFVATDLGVYETANGGATWHALGAGLPNVVVTSLALNATNRDLFAGTYGRSVFSISVPALDCVADLDGSGAVDFGDIVAVLAAWGPCGACPEDFDGDGSVTFADLLRVLADWGPCV